MVADKRKVEGIVRAVLKDIFGADRIGDIHVVRALARTKEEFCASNVAVNGADDRFDPGLAVGVVRHMRRRLLGELADDAFPVISYISNSDMKTVKNAVG